MKTCSTIWFILFALLALSACEKAEPDLLSGDISGLVLVYNENDYLVEDMSNVKVWLRNETFESQTTTDRSGKFGFENIAYGNYLVDLEMEGYFTTYMDYPLHHLGGYSPTLVRYGICEIPKFGTRIDSIRFHETYNRIYLYVTLQELTGLPKIGYEYWCFFSNISEVSEDQFISDDYGWLSGSEINGSIAEIMVELYDNRFDQLKSDSIYCRVYPQAFGPPGPYYFYPESLGKPSNVFSFVFE